MAFCNVAQVLSEDRSLLSAYSGEIEAEIEQASLDVSGALRGAGYVDAEQGPGTSAACTFLFTAGASGFVLENALTFTLEGTGLSWVANVETPAELAPGESVELEAAAEYPGACFNLSLSPRFTSRAWIVQDAEQSLVDGSAVQLTASAGGSDGALARVTVLRALELIHRGLMRLKDDAHHTKSTLYAADYKARMKELIGGAGVPGNVTVDNVFQPATTLGPVNRRRG